MCKQVLLILLNKHFGVYKHICYCTDVKHNLILQEAFQLLIYCRDPSSCTSKLQMMMAYLVYKEWLTSMSTKLWTLALAPTAPIIVVLAMIQFKSS